MILSNFYILIREGIGFMWKLTFPDSMKSPRFETLWLRKTDFKIVFVCLLSSLFSSVALPVTTITFDRTIGMYWTLAHISGTKKNGSLWQPVRFDQPFWFSIENTNNNF